MTVPEYPRTISAAELPPGTRALIDAVAAKLLSGDSRGHAVLRSQLASAAIRDVEMTGTGLFANYECAESIPRLDVSRAIGGDVAIEIEGLKYGAGSLLCVADGAIDFVEIYTQGDEKWPEHLEVVSIVLVLPVPLEAESAS